MAISAATLRSLAKRWSATATIAGVAVQLTDVLPRRSTGFTQRRGICSIQVLTRPDIAADAAAQVWVTLNGQQELFFTGQVDARPLSDLPLGYEIVVADSLGRLAVPVPSPLTWNNVPFATGVRQLLNAAGISDAGIASIFSPGATYALGPVVAVTIGEDQQIDEALDELMTFGGCGLFVDPDGRVRVADAPGWPGATDGSTPVYAFGATANEYGFLRSRRTIGGAESRVSAYQAVGPRKPDKTIPDATYVASGVTGKKVSERYRLIQTEACARAIAAREIVRRNRSSTEVEVEAPLNPALRAGQTILYRNADIGYPTDTPAIIIGIVTNDDTMTMQVSVGPQPLPGTIVTQPPPTANFSMDFERQTVRLTGVTANRTFVSCRSTSSDPSGFPITSRAWTARGNGTVTPESSSEATPVFLFDTLEGASITLAVESGSGEGADVTRVVDPPDAAVVTRTVMFASSRGWKVLNSVFGWRSYGKVACTAVPGFNDKAPPMAGFSNGSLLISTDYLATRPRRLFTFVGAVNCIFINEGDPLHVLVGHGQSLSRSYDGGLTWSPVAAFLGDVFYAESDIANPDAIYVCAGNALLYTTDGLTFAPVITGPDGSQCRKLASAPWGHAAVFSNVSALVDAVRFVEPGLAVDWSQLPEADQPLLGITAITALLDTPGYIVADGAARDVVRDGVMSNLIYLANAGEVSRVYRLLPGPGGFVATKTAQTTDSGPHKLVNATGAFPIDDSQETYRIGYGAAQPLPAPPSVILVPFRGGFLHVYQPGIGWSLRQTPAPDDVWVRFRVNPVYPTRWLLMSTLRAFLSLDSGVSWTEIYTLNVGKLYNPRGTAPTGVGEVTFMDIVWLNNGSQWVLSALASFRSSATAKVRMYIAAGSTSIASANITFGVPQYIAVNGVLTARGGGLPDGYKWNFLASGQDDEIVAWNSVMSVQAVFRVGPSSITRVTEDVNNPYKPVQVRAADDQAMLGVWDVNIGKGDYLAPPSSPIIAAGTSVVETQTGMFAGGGHGVVEILTPDGVATTRDVIGGSTLVASIVAGQKRQGAAVHTASPISDGTNWRYLVYIYDGTRWQTVEAPISLTVAAPTMGVIDP